MGHTRPKGNVWVDPVNTYPPSLINNKPYIWSFEVKYIKLIYRTCDNIWNIPTSDKGAHPRE